MLLHDLPEKLPDNEKRYRYPAHFFFKTDYDLCRAFVMTNFSQNMHVQDFFEINIITRGSGAHYIENNRLMASVGDVFVIPPNVRHGYVGAEGFDVFHLLLSSRFFEREHTDLTLLPSFSTLFHAEPIFRTVSPEQLHLKLSDSQLSQLKPILDELLRDTESHDISSSLVRRGMALSMISQLCNAYTANVGSSGEQSSLDKAFLEALAIIHERYNEKITIELLSKTALLSRSAFIQKFKSVCHMPPAKYLEKRRVEAACYMLESTALSISEIAQRTGFHDSSHLSRSFLSFMEISPGQYRKEHASRE